jgi:hypothetical protein
MGSPTAGKSTDCLLSFLSHFSQVSQGDQLDAPSPRGATSGANGLIRRLPVVPATVALAVVTLSGCGADTNDGSLRGKNSKES